MGVTLRSDAWKWIANQVSGHAPDPQRKYEELAGNIGATSSKISRRNGMRQYSLCALPQMTRDLFDLWDIARLRRVAFNHWELAPRL